MKDILDVLHGNDPVVFPIFVVGDLTKLPPVNKGGVNIASMLVQLAQLRADTDKLQEKEAPVQESTDVSSSMKAMEAAISDLSVVVRELARDVTDLKSNCVPALSSGQCTQEGDSDHVVLNDPVVDLTVDNPTDSQSNSKFVDIPVISSVRDNASSTVIPSSGDKRKSYSDLFRGSSANSGLTQTEQSVPKSSNDSNDQRNGMDDTRRDNTCKSTQKVPSKGAGTEFSWGSNYNKSANRTITEHRNREHGHADPMDLLYHEHSQTKQNEGEFTMVGRDGKPLKPNKSRKAEINVFLQPPNPRKSEMLYIGNLHPNTDNEDLREIIWQQFQVEARCKRLNPNLRDPDFATFQIWVQPIHVDKILDSRNWPEWVVVRRWVKRRRMYSGRSEPENEANDGHGDFARGNRGSGQSRNYGPAQHERGDVRTVRLVPKRPWQERGYGGSYLSDDEYDVNRHKHDDYDEEY